MWLGSMSTGSDGSTEISACAAARRTPGDARSLPTRHGSCTRPAAALRDMQEMAGHRLIDQTQAYIDGSARAKRRLVGLI